MKIILISTTDSMVRDFVVPHIKELERQGHTVECAGAETGFGGELAQKGVIFHQFNFTRFPFTFSNLKEYYRLKKFVIAQRYDAVLCQQPVGGIMGRMVADFAKIPVIYIAHGFHFYKGASLIYRLLYKNIEAIAARKTNALVVMNEEDFCAAKKFRLKDATNQNVFKIHGIGVDLLQYGTPTKTREEMRKSLNINENNIAILCVAEYTKNKNHKLLISALKNLPENLVMLFAGRGKRIDKIKAFAIKVGVSECVKFLGFRPDIPDLLNASDIFTLMSFREGLPKATMEAMAAGLPLVLSNIRGNVDLIQNNNGGFLVAPDNLQGFVAAIQQLAENQKLREDFGKTNKKRIQHFSLENVLDEMNSIYRKINFN